MQFPSYEAAWEFYNTYARHAGFGTRKRNGGYMNNYIVCSREGKNQETVSDYDRKRDKTTKRTGCKARIRVRTIKDVFVIAHVELNHNHRMIESPAMLQHLHSHKRDDPLLDKLVKDMQIDNLTHTQMMSTLSRMSGGIQYMGRTSRDWVNKYVQQKLADISST
jgi:hypothetical protein